jgi:integrase
MSARSLTSVAVLRLKPPSKGQVDYFDKGYPGLALRLSYGGAKSFVFFFRLHGKQKRMTLGRWPGMDLASARQAWQDARLLVGKGENPARARPAAADAFNVVAEEWLKRDQAHHRTYADVRGIIKRYPLPAWGNRPITGITRRDVIELIDTVVDLGRLTMAHRLHSVLHRLFRWCVGRGILDTNPMTDLPRQGRMVKRDRVLTDSELRIVWQATNNLDWPAGPLYRLLILTGARREEIGALRWSEIDGDMIRLGAGRTKNAEPRTIPLSPQALALIRSFPRVGEFVFAAGKFVNGGSWSRVKAALDAAAADLNGGQPLAHWRTHDLRRAVATGLQKLGIGLQTIEAVLGHISGSRSGIVGIYQRHSFDAEKRVALKAWGHHVDSLRRNTTDNIVSLSASFAE